MKVESNMYKAIFLNDFHLTLSRYTEQNSDINFLSCGYIEN